MTNAPSAQDLVAKALIYEVETVKFRDAQRHLP